MAEDRIEKTHRRSAARSIPGCLRRCCNGEISAASPASTATTADLYDEAVMLPELRKAHQNNDRAVMKAYGFDVKTMTESDCVAELMKLYQKLAV